MDSSFINPHHPTSPRSLSALLLLSSRLIKMCKMASQEVKQFSDEKKGWGKRAQFMKVKSVPDKVKLVPPPHLIHRLVNPAVNPPATSKRFTDNSHIWRTTLVTGQKGFPYTLNAGFCLASNKHMHVRLIYQCLSRELWSRRCHLHKHTEPDSES